MSFTRGERNGNQGRGGYNDIRQINATLRESWEEDIINADFTDIPVSDPDGGWIEQSRNQEGSGQGRATLMVDTNDSSSRKAYYEEWEYQITTDGKKLQKIVEERASSFKATNQAVLDWYDQHEQTRGTLMEQLEKRANLMTRYVTDLEDIKEYAEQRSRIIKDRSGRNYREEEKANLTTRRRIAQSAVYFRKLSEKVRNDMLKIATEFDLTRTDHPDHDRLGWQACHTHACESHREAKESMGTWPSLVIPVVIEEYATTEGYTVPAPQWTKN